jgi:hypothetical protein
MKQSKSCATATASLFPNKLLNLAGDQGYSDEDLWNDYAHSAEDFVKHPSVKVVDVSKSNDQDLQGSSDPVEYSASTSPKTIIFTGPGEDVHKAPSQPLGIPPLMVRVRMTNFRCLRRSTEGSGHDEPYFTSASGSDERTDWTWKSKVFGDVSRGHHEHFDGAPKAFIGPVDNYLGITFEAWEHDDDGESWVRALRQCLCGIGDGIRKASELHGNLTHPISQYTMAVGAVAELISYLIDWLMNHDDFIARREVIWTRRALESALAQQPPTKFYHVVLDGGDEGSYQLDFVVDNDIADDSQAMLIKSTSWPNYTNVPAPDSRWVSMASYSNVNGSYLVAVLTRWDGRLSYMKYIDGKWTWPRVIPGDDFCSHSRVSLTVKDGCLWMCFRNTDDYPKLART